MRSHYFRNDDNVPPVWFEVLGKRKVNILDWGRHGLVSCDDYLADEYEPDGDGWFFASEHIIEVTKETFNRVVNKEALKIGSTRLLQVVQCRYWGPNLPSHLHHGWTYEGEQIGQNRFRCLDESGEWCEFQADLLKDSFFVEFRGKDWTTFEDEFIIRPVAKLRIFDQRGFPVVKSKIRDKK